MLRNRSSIDSSLNEHLIISRTVVFIVCVTAALISTCYTKSNLEDVRSAIFHNRKAEAIKLVEETGEINKKGLSGLKERFKRKTS
ncbi:unnamed protein product [Wuchereria bancrofti]|uniref:Uncharacterized protein n=1 Tax=Wuchereria bancrofti TaxID=6293 RepID=A0A3P7FVV6_WUCBA|nr:unnamed protein product [Wuchereria bancrofti]